MVRALGTTAISERVTLHAPDPVERALRLAPGFAERAVRHDREASFPFENFRELSEAGLLALTVPVALGGSGAGAMRGRKAYAAQSASAWRRGRAAHRLRRRRPAVPLLDCRH